MAVLAGEAVQQEQKKKRSLQEKQTCPLVSYLTPTYTLDKWHKAPSSLQGVISFHCQHIWEIKMQIYSTSLISLFSRLPADYNNYIKTELFPSILRSYFILLQYHCSVLKELSSNHLKISTRRNIGNLQKQECRYTVLNQCCRNDAKIQVSPPSALLPPSLSDFLSCYITDKLCDRDDKQEPTLHLFRYHHLF